MRLRLQHKKFDLRLRIVNVPEVWEEARRNIAETEKNTDKSNDCDSYVTCGDARCVL